MKICFKDSVVCPFYLNLFFKYNLNIVSIKVLYISPDGCGTIFNVYYFKLYLFKAINKSIFKLMMTMKAAFLFFHMSRANQNLEIYIPVWFMQLNDSKQFWVAFIGKYFNKWALSEKHETVFWLKTTVFEDII